MWEGCSYMPETYSTWVKVGGEYSTNTKPENAGYDVTGVQHLNENWYHWNTEERSPPTVGLCTSRRASYGEINFGTC